jgi:hypothetical protein
LRVSRLAMSPAPTNHTDYSGDPKFTSAMFRLSSRSSRRVLGRPERRSSLRRTCKVAMCWQPTR